MKIGKVLYGFVKSNWYEIISFWPKCWKIVHLEFNKIIHEIHNFYAKDAYYTIF